MSAWECGDQEMFDKAAKDVALCLTGQLIKTLKSLIVPEEGVEEDFDEPEPEGGDDDDPDGIC